MSKSEHLTYMNKYLSDKHSPAIRKFFALADTSNAVSVDGGPLVPFILKRPGNNDGKMVFMATWREQFLDVERMTGVSLLQSDLARASVRGTILRISDVTYASFAEPADAFIEFFSLVPLHTRGRRTLRLAEALRHSDDTFSRRLLRNMADPIAKAQRRRLALAA